MSADDKFHRCGFVVFDLRVADNPDDAAIEAMVQNLLRFSLDHVKANDLTFPDMLCAAIEFAARLSASATMFHAPSDAHDRLVADITNNFRNRMRDAMQGKSPGGEGDIAQPN